MILPLVLLLFVLIFTSTYILLTIVYDNKIQILLRLDPFKKKKIKKQETDELSQPFYQRVIRPMGEKLLAIVVKTTPQGMKKRMEEKLAMAGKPYNLGINQWFLIKLTLAGLIPIITVIYLGFMGKLFSKNTLLIGVFIGIVNILPDLMLQNRTKRRQKEIINTLPDVLDLVTVSVEAGLSFDGALSRLINNMPGVLSKEFGRVLHEMRMGKGRKEALKDMSQRCGVPDLTTLIGSIIQADELGVGVSNVLRIQSVQMREKRRQRAQEKAMKAPVKMLFPLIFFIFPTIFAVLLGPAIIRMVKAFSN